MIIFLVTGDEFFVGQIRNVYGVTAGVLAVADVGIHEFFHFFPDKVVHGRIRALHFIENNALEGRLAVFIRPVIMPTFLIEDFRFCQNLRMQNGVHVNVHKVQKILVVAAGHRVHGFVGEGHGVEKRLQ